MVVLLTGLIIAFLFNADTSILISGSSANTTRADIFGQGAIDSTIGDFQQEIAAGSTTPAATVGSYGTNTVYMPASATNMVPKPALPSGMTTAVFPNVLKMSIPGVPFSAGDTSNGGQGRAAGSANGTGLTTNASLNNILVSASGWNKALLLPKANLTDTYNFTPAAGFVAPNWILVGRDGSNPTTWNANLEAIRANVNATTPVVGRYAYVIYNEGGLLDANVAGSPVTGTGGAVTYSSMASYKNALAYADLTQLKDSSGNQLLSAADINALVGWRNYASAQATGNFPASSGSVPLYTFPAQSGTLPTPFDLATMFNLVGFLSTSNTALFNKQSDRMFLSRQQLIHFLETIDPANLASMEGVLQYLGTFSRGLSQPSYVSPVSLGVGAPTVQSNSGGNNGPGQDATINPAFLTVRAKTAFTRNDGSAAVVNEPLVKSRFALNRLSWLTYNGPSASRNLSPPSSSGPTATDYDIYALENQDGVTSAFLAQGTAQNIYNYFGLSWVPDPNNSGANEWVYGHAGATPVSSSSSATAINTLSQVTGREPDFFELLKAGICVGSVGKAYVDSTQPKLSVLAAYEASRDRSVDGAIFQIGANIISQSQPSGYPARVLGNNGVGTFTQPQEYRGIVDLPYIYRIREGKVRVTDSTPSYSSSPNNTALPAAGSVSVAGTGAELQEPEIWNPHAWKSTSGADSIPRPTIFRLIAVSTDPNNQNPTAISLIPTWRGGDTTFSDTSAATTPLTLTAANTAMTFQVPSGNYLFREPTLLIKSGFPTGSSLIASSTSVTADSCAAYTPGGPYLGIKIGSIPLAWNQTLTPADMSATSSVTAPSTPSVVPAEYVILLAPAYATYRLQYKSGANWITYDEKYTPIVCSNDYDSWGNPTGVGRGPMYNNNQQVGTEMMATCFDPRTSRFGMMVGGRGGLQATGSEAVDFPPWVDTSLSLPGAIPPSYYWLNVKEGALWSMRPDENQGFVFSNTADESHCQDTGAGAVGWYPAGAASSNYPGYSNAIMRPGLSAQNNPAMASATSLIRFTGDTQSANTSFSLGCYADPDGVIRRGMAAYVPPNGTPASTAPFAAGAASSIPLKPAYTVNSGSITPNADAASRPIMLNRPFRSVAELGYVFSDTPWRNIDMTTPESGNAALLDLFCVNGTEDPNGLVAGKVDLNTRQAPVLQAILAGAYEDEFSASSATSSSTTASAINPVIGASSGSATADKIAQGLVTRTGMATTPGGPLMNISELVGKWNSQVAAQSSIDGGQSYTGFSGTAATSASPPSTPENLSDLLAKDASVMGYNASYVQRYRAATIRALSNAGQVRVWNVMIDLVAQTGRYPASATNLDQFVVEGQQRYWVHLAIDRMTGKVLDKRVEVVKE